MKDKGQGIQLQGTMALIRRRTDASNAHHLSFCSSAPLHFLSSQFPHFPASQLLRLLIFQPSTLSSFQLTNSRTYELTNFSTFPAFPISQRPNFSNYIFREDMVMDAAENCVIYVSSFDPEKSKNPFSYFTQVCWYAFIRRIKKEKRQIEICDKLIEKSGFEVFFTADEGGSSSDYNSIKDCVEQKRKGG